LNEGTDRERYFDATGTGRDVAIAGRLVQSDEPRSGEELVRS
jgi:hypothetical protein